MFALFFTLYYAMFRGAWPGGVFTYGNIKTILEDGLNSLGELITSIFNGTTTPMSTLGTDMFNTIAITEGTSIFANVPVYLGLVSFILALITSIGIVVMAVKGVKRLFGVFFASIR